MTYDGSILAEGQLPSSTGDLYTSTGVRTIVKSIHISNTNTSWENVIIYTLKSGSTAREYYRGFFGPNYFDEAIKGPGVLTLGSGDKLQGVTTTASKVDFTISGATQAV